MNERIRKLAEQAQLHARQGMAKTVIELKRYDADVASERYAKDFEQKFAELIVRECAGIASEYDAPKMSGPGMIIANRIESHFGVEE